MHRLILPLLFAAGTQPAQADHRECGARVRSAARFCRAARSYETARCCGVVLTCRPVERRACVRRWRAASRFPRLAPGYSRLGIVFTLEDPIFDRRDVKAAYDGAPPAVAGLLGEQYLIDSPR
ncbi:MAG: hypothetical protein ACT4PV_01535 [Planctomycetaceae bacterium]